MATMFKPRFLLISIGNPLPEYTNTLHSAGHIGLIGLQKTLQLPPFQTVKLTKKERYLMTEGPKYTLIQSPTYMNISGRFVAGIWRRMLTQHEPSNLSLVVVHDNIDRIIGDVRLTAWDLSPRGHNGILSVKNELSQGSFTQSPMLRMGIGVGRPVQRDPETVSNYVLSKMPFDKQKILEEEVPVLMAKKLLELEETWRKQVESPGVSESE
ncbi:hypothetical protein E4U17_000146 [Claviceps sp. LM77 group G4]|nr:hypothetical protein E4U33_008087 [Claviceps sp. LM78 group G4]KAG6058308.1 hypothetical protein E4U17_000146 [Claviceps sp. LM77 group G4]KAG6075816.1 hypothetical protein E4U16_003143 [Claviceps sp. LM84 group G4]